MISIIDETIYNVIIQLFSVPTTLIMTFISHLGSATAVILLSIIFLILLKDKKLAASISINLVLVYLINVIIKEIVARPRPEILRLVHETSYSFPSGHAMVSAGFYGYLIYIAYKKLSKKSLRNTVIALLSILILLIGISRIYLGVHYASDVLAGFVLSIAYLGLFTHIIKTTFKEVS